MTRDHARRNTGSRQSSTPRKATSTRAKRQPVAAVRFHPPSFSYGLFCGVCCGVAMVLSVAYLPELTAFFLQRPTTVTSTSASPGSGTATAGSAEQELRFEFEEILSNSEVNARSGRYEQPAEALAEYFLQAAAFRTQEEADRLRASLLLMDLPTSTEPVELANGRWIRVTVGPFATPVAANRAVTALRSRDISPIWIKRTNAG